MNYTHTDNIISDLYVNASKSFREFYSDFYQYKAYSNNYLITDKYIIFDNIKPTITKLEKQYLTLQEFYKQSKKAKRLDNLICLFFYKFKTISKITRTKENEIINIYNPYKELARTITYPEDNDFTHLLTISYPHSLNSDVFKIMEDNKQLRKKINKGTHRLRSYVYKKLKDELKKKITEKELLNEKVKELKKKVFKYFKVYELHASNHLHAHILIKLPDFITRLNFKNEIIPKFVKWFETEPQGIDLKRLSKNKRNAKRYVLKYIFKQFNNDNVFYVVNRKKEKIYFIKKDAIIRNDIPRMISRSRNIKTKRFKPFFTIQKEQVEKKEKEIKEINRFELEISQKNYEDFKEILKDFRTTREKLIEYEIEQAEKRTEILEKLKLFLDDRYFSINDILRCLDFCKLDKITQQRYNELYLNALYKLNRLLDKLEKTEEIEIIDF
jgi:hypothetical protein